MTGDHYAALGVSQEASIERIRAAYVRVMREHHPDLHPGDAAAAEVARRANIAWSVLKDPRRRAAYDALRRPRAPSAPVVDASTLARATADVAGRAYSSERTDYRAAIQSACLRVGAAVFILGLLLALALA